MNKWKTAFWVSITVLCCVTIFFIYETTNQAFTTVSTSLGYSETTEDLNTISTIINETDLSKSQIKNLLKQHRLFYSWNFDKDTISLNRVNLIFEGNKLTRIANQK